MGILRGVGKSVVAGRESGVRSASNALVYGEPGLEETIVQTAMAAIWDTCLRTNAGGDP